MSVAPAVERIPPCSGRAVELEAGDELVVIDPMGQQVSDLTAFSRADLAEYLSSGPVEQLQLQADRLPGRARVVSGSMRAPRFGHKRASSRGGNRRLLGWPWSSPESFHVRCRPADR